MASVAIITYNKKLETIGLNLCSSAIGVMLVSVILYYLEDFKVMDLPKVQDGVLLIAAVMLMLSFVLGIVLTNVAQGRLTEVGKIIIGESATTITANDKITVFENRKVKVNFSRKGFKGEVDIYAYINVGSISENPGINTITFYDGADKLSFDVLIETGEQYAAIIDDIKKRFAQ